MGRDHSHPCARCGTYVGGLGSDTDECPCPGAPPVLPRFSPAGARAIFDGVDERGALLMGVDPGVLDAALDELSRSIDAASRPAPAAG